MTEVHTTEVTRVINEAEREFMQAQLWSQGREAGTGRGNKVSEDYGGYQRQSSEYIAYGTYL